MRVPSILLSFCLLTACGGDKSDDSGSTATATTGVTTSTTPGTPTGTATGTTTSCPDGDGDGVCDDVDVCDGADSSGDSDMDGTCDDIDACPLDAAPDDDVDADGVCNSDDICDGADTIGDTDLDGVCDDLDPCPVDSPDDSDGDGVCDSVDQCQGDDAAGDLDMDGVCADIDVCAGDDATGDTDADGVCDDSDVCPGGDDASCVALTEVWFLTGYFSEWGAGDQWDTVFESQVPGTCAARAGSARGDCMRVTYDRDPDGDGAGPFFSGYFWQYPANNWGQDDDGDGLPDLGPGFAVPAGVTQVSFWAWGATGGEMVNFKAGLNAADGFEIATGIQTLSTTPTQFTIDVSGASVTEVTGGFAWIMEWDVAPIGSSWTFYLDDVVWE